MFKIFFLSHWNFYILHAKFKWNSYLRTRFWRCWEKWSAHSIPSEITWFRRYLKLARVRLDQTFCYIQDGAVQSSLTEFISLRALVEQELLSTLQPLSTQLHRRKSIAIFMSNIQMNSIFKLHLSLLIQTGLATVDVNKSPFLSILRIRTKFHTDCCFLQEPIFIKTGLPEQHWLISIKGTIVMWFRYFLRSIPFTSSYIPIIHVIQ